jgi:DNA transformation protein
MAVTKEYREWVLEQLRYAGPVTARSMFGGVGLYLDGLFFALIDDDSLYFKVDDSNRPDFEAAGMGPFMPGGDPKLVMQYYEVPAEVLEEPQRLREWAERALAVARRKKKR